MGWQLELLIVFAVIAASIGLTAYILGLGGRDRRARQVREHLEGLTGTVVTVVIGTVEDQELQSITRIAGVVVGVSNDGLVLSPSDGASADTWVWPVADGTVRVRLERILGIERADGEMVFT
jgi:hypothetical protein